MSQRTQNSIKLPPDQEAIRAKCFHPSGSFVEFPRDDVEKSIPERFEKIASMYPDRVAIKTKDRALTYGEMNLVANRLAGTILDNRGRKYEPVAVLFESAVETMTAILGVLKAGRFFLVLDPSFPLQRLASVLKDSGAGLIVSNRWNIGIATALLQSSQSLLLLDSLNDSASTADIDPIPQPGTLSHLVYTSGSTGAPKGVMQTHVNMLHEIMAYTNNFHICAEDRITLLASCSSGQGIKNAFCALLNGARLDPFDIRTEGAAALASHLIQEEITVYHSSAGLFRSFMALTRDTQIPEMRLIRLASQQVVYEDIDLYKKYFSPDCILVNALSTTETGTFRWYFMTHETAVGEHTVPVGYALEDKTVVLVDETNREVGDDEVGEIVVKSPYIFPGYWQGPDLIELNLEPKSRVERVHFSGDMGHMAADGCLFHLGRKDLQIKVRGYRVETDEVERALLKHPAIREAVVAGQEDRCRDTQIVAYFVPSSQSVPTTTELRGFLKERLPDYMIPSVYQKLDKIPLTANGKLDRRALPAPDHTRPELDNPFVAPSTPVEETLAGIWAEVLQLEKVGVDDNFFDLGGHSLAAARVVARVFQQFHLEIPLQALFESPTVAEMAKVIAEHREKPLGEEELRRILAELDLLPEEEAKRLLSSRTESTSRKQE